MAKSTLNHVKTANTKGENTMTINEYAQAIAQAIEGARVTTVEKANGIIKTAVCVPTGQAHVSGNFYVDDAFNEGMSIEDAIKKARAIGDKTPAFGMGDIDAIYNYDLVRPKIRARLYNKATSAEVYRSASKYGFDDLIITAHVEDLIPDGSVKITRALVEKWGVTPEEVLDIAEENSRENARLRSMADTLREMGYDIPFMDENPMIIATNNKMTFGAYAVIAKLDELKARFKNGFTVLPSSVHEVIIVDAQDERAMSAMVNEVNTEAVIPEEQLSNHAYTIAA